MVKRTLMCTVAILFAASLALAAPHAKAKTAAKSWWGWVTDTNCGAKGAEASHAACLKKCIGKGAKYALYVPATKKVYTLDPQDKAEEYAAKHVRVHGTLKDDTITATSFHVLVAKKAAKKKAGS